MDHQPWTPKPWAAFTDDSGGQPHTNIVAVVPVTACVLSLPGRHKNEPDVQLITAAPDLFDALDEMVRWYGKRGGEDALLPAEEQESEIAAAIRALAKARGK